jgi:predicted DNA-binding protein with PD1-like motif
MRYTQASLGRVFLVRLEDGDRLPETIEHFAHDHGVTHAMVTYLGGAAGGSRMVVGPEEGQGERIVPIVHTFTGCQEVLGTGILAPNASGQPVLHMHAAIGREGRATVGCTRAGVDVWLVGEVMILEITGANATRHRDPQSGLELLTIT